MLLGYTATSSSLTQNKEQVVSQYVKKRSLVTGFEMLNPGEHDEKYKKSGIEKLFFIGTGEKILPSKESDRNLRGGYIRDHRMMEAALYTLQFH